MFSAHICDELLAIGDDCICVAKLKTEEIHPSGFDRFVLEHESLSKVGREQSLDLYLRGFVAALRMIQPESLVTDTARETLP